MGVKVGEFFIDLAVDAASGNLSVKQLVGALGELDVASVAGVGVVTKITETLWGMAKAATESAVELTTLNELTGAEPKFVQQWEKAAQRINILPGTIGRAVKAVNDMMGAISANKMSPPGELSGILGILPDKIDAQGNRIKKTFQDIMKELADPKSRYWSLPSDQVRQQILGGAMPGVDRDAVFRILNEMKAGRWHPELITGMSKGQVKELTDVDRQWIGVKQQVTDVFQQFLTAGGAVAEILSGAKDLLIAVKELLDMPEVKKLLHAGGGVVSAALSGLAHPVDVLGTLLGQQGMTSEDAWAKGLENKLKLATAGATPGGGDLRGKLDINLLGPKGEQLGHKEAWLNRKVSNADTERVTVNLGNGGQGQ